MKKILLFSLFLGAAFQSQAALVTTSQAKACGLLSEIGLKTRGWKNYYGNEYGCSSSYKDIGSGVIPNNIAFYVEGNRSNARQVKLVININRKSGASSAHNELLKASKVLSKKATGSELPKDIIKAIQSGTSLTKKVANSNVKVERINWPNGNGYEVKVIMK